MRLTIFLVLCSLVLGYAVEPISPRNEARIASFSDLRRLKFIMEIVYRVQKPLQFKEWIKLGKKLITDEDKYKKYIHGMSEFAWAYEMGTLLPKDDFFGATVFSHRFQAYGLFCFFYLASDWDTFQRNVCWARIHVNPGMFVYALYMTVIRHENFNGLMLPQIYEIFPQHFFNSKFIYKVKEFKTSAIIQNEEEFPETYNKSKNDLLGNPKYLQDWKQWQWWKLMGLDERCRMAGVSDGNDKKAIVRYNTEYKVDNVLYDALHYVKLFWMPVDYTRDFQILNPESKLSYLMEDVDFNAAWYYIHLNSAEVVLSEESAKNGDRPSEWWMFVSRMYLARLRIERLSHGLGDFPPLARNIPIKTGYNPQLVSWNGVPFLQRYNNYNYTDSDKIRCAVDELNKAMKTGYYLKNGTTISMSTPEGYKYIFQYLDMNAATSNDLRFCYYHFEYNYLAWNDDDPSHVFDVLPSTFLNFETMWRDPLFATFMNAKIIDRYNMMKFPPYTKDELKLEGVQINNVELDELITFFDYSDIDVTNLLNEEMRWFDRQYQWDRSLFARQQRLNHKPFGYKLNVHSTALKPVVVRAFLGPKYDDQGKVYSLQENWQNFMQIEEFVTILKAGDNVVHRKPEDRSSTHPDRVSYTELYKLVLSAMDRRVKYQLNLNISAPYYTFARRLMLPKGWDEGFPVQFFFMITPYTKQELNADFDWTRLGNGTRFLDDLNMGYPFDRAIGDEAEFKVPNMYFKDAKIFHVDYAEKYESGYANFGKFDYQYWTAEDIKYERK